MAKASRKTAIRPDQTKECPFCAETIKARAHICKHCGRDLPDTAPSAAAIAPVHIAPVHIAPAINALPLTQQPAPAIPRPSLPREPSQLKPIQVLDLLTRLVDKSLVVYEEDEKGQGRYRLLETVRQYARDRMHDNEEAHTLRSCHCEHFLALAEQAHQKIGGLEAVRWLNTLETEHDNLRAALEWCLTDEAPTEAGLRLSADLGPFWDVRGYVSEGAERLAAALSRPGGAGRTRARAAALTAAGTMAMKQGDVAPRRAFHEEALSILRELGDKKAIGRALHSLGNVARDQGEPLSARAFFEEALAFARELGDKAGMANTLNSLGLVSKNQADYAAARGFYEEGMILARELGNQRFVAGMLINLGAVAYWQADYGAARGFYEEGLLLLRELGDKGSMAAALSNLGELACQEGDFAAARARLAESLRLHRELRDKYCGAHTLEYLAELAHVQQQPKRAVQLYGASDALRHSIGVPAIAANRAKIDGELAVLRAGLSEGAFNAAWAAGRAMLWEQAVDYALSES